LWEIEATLDLDGWGTGNGKNNQATGVGSMLQRGAVNFHGENISPWLPTVQFGMEVQNAFGNSLSRQGSGATGAQAEYDLLTRNMGFNTGRAGSGVVLNWDDKDLSGIGIPGRIGKFQIGMSTVAEGDDGTQSLTDRQSFNVYGSIQPFSQVKNKWISGLTFEGGTWFCNNDSRDPNGSAVCLDRFRVQDHGDGGRTTLFDTGSGSVGDGLATGTGVGIVWNVGPYTARIGGSWFQAADRGGTQGKKRAHDFLIGHDLYVWSPKGFLTGSATTTGSVLVGTHFERTDISSTCSSVAECGGGATSLINQFHRNRILLREWDLWYVIAPRMNIGINWLWYDASNLGNRTNQAGYQLGKCNKTTGTATDCRVGVGGDWVDVMLNWRYTF
jgi:hypothetical protein